jgi:PII-like signaling protein
MQGVYLKFFLHENHQLHGRLAYEWLLEQARKAGIRGGSALRAIAGYGRHGVLHEDHFFELAGDLPIVVEFVVSEDEAQRLLDMVSAERASLLYVKIPVAFGVTGNADRQ